VNYAGRPVQRELSSAWEGRRVGRKPATAGRQVVSPATWRWNRLRAMHSSVLSRSPTATPRPSGRRQRYWCTCRESARRGWMSC